MSHPDPTLRRYLLGQLPEKESERVERSYFEDDDSYTRLLEAEDDLLDDYANDRLPPEARARCQSFFLGTLERQERASLARILGRRISSDVRETPLVPPHLLAEPPVWAIPMEALRGEEGRSVFTPAEGSDRIRLSLQSDHLAGFQRYRVVIRDSRDRVVDSRDDLRIGPDEEVPTLDVDAGLLPPGLYRIELLGVRSDGDPEPLGATTIEVAAPAAL